MRDSGWDQLPPDVRFAGEAPAENESPPWIAIYLNHPLTPTKPAGVKKVLANSEPSTHGTSRSLRKLDLSRKAGQSRHLNQAALTCGSISARLTSVTCQPKIAGLSRIGGRIAGTRGPRLLRAAASCQRL